MSERIAFELPKLEQLVKQKVQMISLEPQTLRTTHAGVGALPPLHPRLPPLAPHIRNSLPEYRVERIQKRIGLLSQNSEFLS